MAYLQTKVPRDCHEAVSQCPSIQNTSFVSLIKPDGYEEPFDVFCDKDTAGGSTWTVIQRRLGETIIFNRSWSDYKHGFGFPGREFWIGNEKLAHLTNQKRYELRMEFENPAGQSYYVTYEYFRIDDELGNYAISSLGNFGGNAGYQSCLKNARFFAYKCDKTCERPYTCDMPPQQGCFCPKNYLRKNGKCLPKSRCGCFLNEEDRVLEPDEVYINIDCSRRYQCTDNRLSTEQSFACSTDATCDERDGQRGCYCNTDYVGDGVTCVSAIPKNCNDIFLSGVTNSGKYRIYPIAYPDGINVYCDMDIDGGGWTVFQRRTKAVVDFNQGWNEYKIGFGSPKRDHWLGNDKIHALTNQKEYKLRIDMRHSDGNLYYALYSNFSIRNVSDKYRLSLGDYSGNAGKNAMSYSNGQQFSTHDEDHDGWRRYNCADNHRGAWWFGFHTVVCSACDTKEEHCHYRPENQRCCVSCNLANLNGEYNGTTRGTNIYWGNANRGIGCGLTFTEMKIKPV
ncbi:Ficolin-2 [Apostichopus japonicus]|uniref:Ficolin-2 n=1 Tax=Stichopus japonicus TaxID=307972 RepID=A0A2G8LMH3_STIJA|nr:Ficolin-2 [Apostichopus japonicus]